MKRTSPFTLVTKTFRRFPSILLFKNGIEELLEILQEEEPSAITIADLDYEYDSLTEFFTTYQGKEVKFLKFLAFYSGKSSKYSESVTIEIGRSGVSFFATKTTANLLVILLRFEQFFKIHERRFTAFFFNPYLYSIAVLCLLFVVWRTISAHSGLWFSLDVFLLLIAVVFFFQNRFGRFSRIFTIDRHEQESFWYRNKDEITRQIISNILSFALGLLAAYLLFKSGIKF